MYEYHVASPTTYLLGTGLIVVVVVASGTVVVVVSPGYVVVVDVVDVEVVVDVGTGFFVTTGSATWTRTTDWNLTTVPAAGLCATALAQAPLKAPGPVVSKYKPADFIAL
jgi:hypothetical protein